MNEKGFPKYLLYVTAAMSLLYIGIGFFVLFNEKVRYTLPYPYYIFLGMLSIAYGFFRMFRFYKLFFKK